jgi:hypothetical protein
MSAQSSRRGFLIRRIAVIASCLAAACWLSWSADAQEEKKGPIQITMRAKLDAAAKVLEGLATEDKTLIHEGAEVLTAVSKAEVWQILKDAEYREHTQAFRSAIKRLDEAAQESRFASAQLEWLDATKKCFDCHNHIRSEKNAAEAK